MRATARWRVAIHFRATADEKVVRALVAAAAGAAAAKALRFERVAAKDWVSESLAGLKPVEAGRFIVHGAHDRARIPVNRIGIEIEAALAFGTGHHGTTRGCLSALDRMCKSLGKPRRRTRVSSPCRGRIASVLDVGTGSGVLAIAAARAFRQRVLATDIDATAVRAARANARLNRVGGFVEVVRADGVTAAQPARTGAVWSRLRQHPAGAAAAVRRAAYATHRSRRPRNPFRLAAVAGERRARRLSRACAGAAHRP